MEEIRRRALQLAHMVGCSEDPFSQATRDAEEQLKEYLSKVDPQTQKEIMERIRSYSL